MLIVRCESLSAMTPRSYCERGNWRLSRCNDSEQGKRQSNRSVGTLIKRNAVAGSEVCWECSCQGGKRAAALPGHRLRASKKVSSPRFSSEYPSLCMNSSIGPKFQKCQTFSVIAFSI